MSAEPAIRVRGLRKAYDGVEAVRGIDFDVQPGEVFGLLGPNGAGKTTTVEILEGYRPRDAGEVSVLGTDPWRSSSAHRERIGVVLQHSELPPTLSVREVHRMFAGYFERPRPVDEVIELVGLADKADARVKTLSGGQKRRLDLGVALVGDPELVFLDEPTTGFDPSARRTAWDLVRALRSLGKTILLTTHYLDEAQQLADRVAVIREGELIRIGTPHELIAGAPEVEIRYREEGREVVVATAEPTRVLAELTGRALAEGRELEALEVRRAEPRGRLPRPRRRGARVSALRPRAPHPAAHVLAEPGVGGLHLRLPADALPAPRRGLRRRHRRRPGGRPPARRDPRLRLREHRARRPRDHARDPARGRDPEAAAGDAAPARDVHRRPARLDAASSSCSRWRRPSRSACSSTTPQAPQSWAALVAGAAARRARLRRRSASASRR